MFDSVVLSQILKEMALSGSHVNKITQPGRDVLYFSLYGVQGARRLLISANASAPRLQYTETLRENPDIPPNFCMLLRKYLGGALITQAAQPGFDRIAELSFSCADEFGGVHPRRLICELMGRYSNIILVGSDGRIIDSLRHVDDEMNPSRQVLPGLVYRYPDMQGRLGLEESTPEAVCAALPACEGQKAVGVLLARFGWLSPLTARECAHRASIDADAPLDAANISALAGAVNALRGEILAGETGPYMLWAIGAAGQREKPADYSYICIDQYGSTREGERFVTYSAMLDAFYARREAAEHMLQRSGAMRKSVRGAKNRLMQKLEAQRAELAASQDREALKRSGDAILASVYLLEKGQTRALLSDYNAQPDVSGIFPTIEVALDARLNPQDNAQAYYKKYRRAKNAEEKLHALISDGERELAYLESVLDALARADSERTLGEIRAELEANGYASQRFAKKKPGGKPRKAPPVEPMEFSFGGYTIYAGRNNIQNEYVTFRLAGRGDIWFHAQHVPGSHVLLVCRGQEPTPEVLEACAQVAAWHSGARTAGRCAVDYTAARNVRRQSGGKPGMVFYNSYQTILVTPDEKRVGAMAGGKKGRK